MAKNHKKKHAHSKQTKVGPPKEIKNFINTITSYVNRGKQGDVALTKNNNKLKLIGTYSNLKNAHGNFSSMLPPEVTVFMEKKLQIAV